MLLAPRSSWLQNPAKLFSIFPGSVYRLTPLHHTLKVRKNARMVLPWSRARPADWADAAGREVGRGPLDGRGGPPEIKKGPGISARSLI
jgi:hypothetical protein